MVIKYGSFFNLLNKMMFRDVFTAKRKEYVLNTDGSRSSQVLNSFLTDEPCIVYALTKDSSRDRNKDVSEQKQSFTIFYGNHCEIQKGDILICSVLDDNGNVLKVVQGFAGSPCPYPDHSEVDLYEWKVSADE